MNTQRHKGNSMGEKGKVGGGGGKNQNGVAHLQYPKRLGRSGREKGRKVQLKSGIFSRNLHERSSWYC